MSTPPLTVRRTWWQQWTDFWFAPTDPTSLGFIRVVTGLLVVYAHLTYSLDLQQFFGKFGWYGSAYVERERKEYPSSVSSFWKWTEEDIHYPRLPEFQHRRTAMLRFLRNAVEHPSDGNLTVSYIRRMTQIDRYPEQPSLNLVLIIVEATNETRRTQAIQDMLLQNLADGHQLYLTRDDKFQPVFERKPPPENSKQVVPAFFPQFVLDMPETERRQVVTELRGFVNLLPADPAEDRFVIFHLIELDTGGRMEFAGWLESVLKEPSLDERLRIIDFLERWNADPRQTYRLGNTIVSVWFHVTDPTQMAVTHAIILVVMLLFTIGFCTRLTSVLTWLAAIGYIHRTQQVLFGMDTMMNILLIYLMIGNSGAALSVDRLIARYRAARASLRRTGTIDPRAASYLASPPPSRSANLAIRLIQIHFCIIYLAAGLSKLKGAAWWNGRAFWDVMVNQEFTLMRYEWYETMVRALASIKPVYYVLSAGGVWFTLFLEIGFPFLVWTRLRPFMVWLAVLLHAAIGVLMGLNLFELFMMAMLLAFIQTSVIRSRLSWTPESSKVRYRFDPADPPAQRAAATIAAADLSGGIVLDPKPKSGNPVLIADPSTVATARTPITELFGHIRLWKPLRWVLWVPGLRGLITRFFFQRTA